MGKTLRAAAAHRRSLDDVTFIGVTGSSGKTTTKELIAAVLGTQMSGKKNVGSANRPRAVARTILRTKPEHRFAVAEVSATWPGMVQEAAELLQPDVAVVTTIGREHYKSFRTKEATAAEKGALVAAVPEHGVAVLNADDPYVASMAALARGRIVTFGTSAGAALRADEIRAAWPDRLAFTLRHGSAAYRVQTRLCGKQWTPSILAAVAVGVELGVPIEEAIGAVESFEPIPGRMSIVEHGGVTFVRDDWKAPLWSFDRVLEFLGEARAPRKLLVVGTISDYSESASRVYARVAERARAVADEVVFVGPQARHAAKVGNGVRTFASLRDAATTLRSLVRAGDLVLVKGSNKVDHLFRLVMVARGERIRCWRYGCGRDAFCDACSFRRVPGRVSVRLEVLSPRSRGARART